jgi:mannose-6-phosphate isomerase-like protein (cupin superfamily)
MKHPYLIDLNKEENWLWPQTFRRPDGSKEEDQRTISLGQGQHRLFCFTDSVIYPREDAEPGKMPFHEHSEGYEYFFLDSGSLDLYVDGKKALVGAGSVVFYQPRQAHGIVFHEPSKLRRFCHDFRNSDTAYERALLKQHRPEIMQGRDYFTKILALEHDTIPREPILCKEVPVEQMSAVRSIERPLEEFQLGGVTMKMLTTRWENGGVNELWAAEMEPGFYAEWTQYPAAAEMYYITAGEIRFKVYDNEFIAYPECLGKIPKFADHSFHVQRKAVMYDIGGLTRWQALLEDYASICAYDPDRAKDPEAMERLKAKYGCLIKSFGMR